MCLGNIDCIDFQSVHWKYKLDRLSVSVGNTDLSKITGIIGQFYMSFAQPNPSSIVEQTMQLVSFL